MIELLERGDRDGAARVVAEAVADGPDAAAALRALERATDASAALRAGRVDELSATTLAALETTPPSVPDVSLLVGSLLQACYRFTGEPSFRRLALEVCGRVGDRLDVPHLAVRARALMGSVHLMHGALHRALEHCDAALALSEAARLGDDASAAMAHQFRGYVLFEWNRRDEAEAALRRAWDLAGERGKGVRSGAARVMAGLRAAARDRSGADRWMARLESIVSEPMTLRNREWLAAVRVRQSLGTGDLAAAAAWLRTYDYRAATLAALDGAELLARLHELEQVLALLEATEQWDAVARVGPLVLGAARHERRWFAARAASAEAVALEALGHHGRADRRLAEALALGDEGSFVRAYLESGPAGARLRRTLLERAASGEGAAAAGARRVLASDLPDPQRPALTPAQAAVLERVAAGGSNKAVARELGVSVNTVRAHLRAAFDRLGVTSRTQAVARAREEGLIRS